MATTTNVNAGTAVQYEITGRNPAKGTTRVGANGLAEISWVGRTAGLDTVSAFADIDGDGVRDMDEPTARRARITWLGARGGPGQGLGTLETLPPPIAFETVNVQPVAGRVRARLGTANSRWVALRGALALPAGSYLDASRGAVLVQSAVNRSGSRRQVVRVSRGAFRIHQPRATRPIAELTLTGGSFRARCRTGGRRVVRRLSGSGAALVRVIARRSTATTLRGAGWKVEDRCDGTLTRVTRRPRAGRVDVRDIVRWRTVRLRAGRSYLARPRTTRR